MSTQTVVQQAAKSAARNIMLRNSRLDPEVVERTAVREFTQAQSAGRLFTAKEVSEIEDRVYTLVGVKASIEAH